MKVPFVALLYFFRPLGLLGEITARRMAQHQRHKLIRFQYDVDYSTTSTAAKLSNLVGGTVKASTSYQYESKINILIEFLRARSPNDSNEVDPFSITEEEFVSFLFAQKSQMSASAQGFRSAFASRGWHGWFLSFEGLHETGHGWCRSGCRRNKSRQRWPDPPYELGSCWMTSPKLILSRLRRMVGEAEAPSGAGNVDGHIFWGFKGALRTCSGCAPVTSRWTNANRAS